MYTYTKSHKITTYKLQNIIMNKLKNLMRQQIQELLHKYTDLVHQQVPRVGWVKTIRNALGVSTSHLADRLQCSRSNISAIEQREQHGKITLETLEEIAQAMNCKLVYALVPIESIEALRKKQAIKVATKKIQQSNHSMRLEDQGLNEQQLIEKQNRLVQDLLENNSTHLWDDDAV